MCSRKWPYMRSSMGAVALSVSTSSTATLDSSAAGAASETRGLDITPDTGMPAAAIELIRKWRLFIREFNSRPELDPLLLQIRLRYARIFNCRRRLGRRGVEFHHHQPSSAAAFHHRK